MKITFAGIMQGKLARGLVSLIVISLLLQAHAYATILTVGSPKDDGNIVVQAVEDNKVTIDQKNKKVTIETTGPITGIVKFTKGMDADKKASAIADAIKKLNNIDNATSMGNKDSATITITPKASVKGIQNFDNGQEKIDMMIKGKDAPDTPEVALVGFNGNLSGVDSDNNEAVYQASLGDDSFSAVSDLTFSTVLADAIKTNQGLLDTLLTDTYNMLLSTLSTDKKPNLYLDLSDHIVAFVYPDTSTDQFASNFTSDVSTAQQLGIVQSSISFIPEPSSIGIFELSIAVVGVISYVVWLRP